MLGGKENTSPSRSNKDWDNVEELEEGEELKGCHPEKKSVSLWFFSKWP